MRFVTTLALIALFAWLVGRAVDYELARAEGMLSERGSEWVATGARSDAPAQKISTRSESVQPTTGGGDAYAIPTADDRDQSGVYVNRGELYQGRDVYWWARRAIRNRREANQQRRNSEARGRTIRRLKRELASHRVTGISPTLAIRLVFGADADEALRVAWCESRWTTTATNGQYLGLFQMGGYARSRYGHSHSALGQARAAYAYFVDSGRDWSPWSCKP